MSCLGVVTSGGAVVLARRRHCTMSGFSGIGSTVHTTEATRREGGVRSACGMGGMVGALGGLVPQVRGRLGVRVVYGRSVGIFSDVPCAPRLHSVFVTHELYVRLRDAHAPLCPRVYS